MTLEYNDLCRQNESDAETKRQLGAEIAVLMAYRDVLEREQITAKIRHQFSQSENETNRRTIEEAKACVGELLKSPTRYSLGRPTTRFTNQSPLCSTTPVIRTDHMGDDHMGDDHMGDDHMGDDHMGDDHMGDDHMGDDNHLNVDRRATGNHQTTGYHQTIGYHQTTGCRRPLSSCDEVRDTQDRYPLTALTRISPQAFVGETSSASCIEDNEHAVVPDCDSLNANTPPANVYVTWPNVPLQRDCTSPFSLLPAFKGQLSFGVRGALVEAPKVLSAVDVSSVTELWTVLREHCSTGRPLDDLRLRAGTESGGRRGDVVDIIRTKIEELPEGMEPPVNNISLPALWSFQCDPKSTRTYAMSTDRVYVAGVNSPKGAFIVGQNVVIVRLGDLRERNASSGAKVQRHGVTVKNMGELAIQALVGSFKSEFNPSVCGTQEFRDWTAGFPLRLQDGVQLRVGRIEYFADICRWRPRISYDGTGGVKSGTFTVTLRRLTASLKKRKDFLSVVTSYLNGVHCGIKCSSREEKESLESEVDKLLRLLDSQEELRNLALFNS
ncbi:hypothetical protein GNI_122850 [Gregarina niphandrodes]|uniref:Uncharacterized protein n=1 Tax=Gregarina niphandrodes TaxID=110365 RepID=A0A023B2B6_GRENI|nr:hypothetical protein GNI_122850 [Gregarina niphandrodes]EZG52439.1 hypothetical protein GNI_122850 [Gregarina niphandrodes]|eukprot:XP_011131895.1 hypothetical protein GNI_122850 [Gregarina niphandrodes]